MENIKLLVRKILFETYLKEDDDIDWELYELVDEVKRDMMHDFLTKVDEHKKKYCIMTDPDKNYKDKSKLTIFDPNEYLEDPEKAEPYWDCNNIEDEKGYGWRFEGRQNWTLIPINTLKNVWWRFATTPPGIDIPPATIKTLNRVISIMIENIIKVEINTEMTGHKPYFPDEQELEDWGLTRGDLEMWYGDYCEDDMKGQMRISDFAMERLLKKVEELRAEDDPHKRWQIADATLEVVHVRSDIAGWFVKGGSNALSVLSGYERDQVAEARKIIRKILMESREHPKIPNLAYHGQPPKYDSHGIRTEPPVIDKFNLDNKRFLKDGNVGFYFTPNEHEAASYAEGGNVYICTLDIKNPYYYESIFSYNNKGLIKSATFIDMNDKNKLEENGYDGVVLLDGINRIGEIVALYPEQIKIIKVGK